MLINAIYPAMHRATSSVVATSEKLGDRIETSIDIIEMANQSSYEYVWVKNTGSSEIPQIENSDVFFGEINDFRRITFNSTLSVTPSWNYEIDNDDGDGRWDVGETLNITINTSTSIAAGDYYVKIIVYNGISDEDKFSI
jgi:archaellum component FlaG (FlaF/FlaG flagellin family)